MGARARDGINRSPGAGQGVGFGARPGTAALGVGLFAFGIMAGDFAMMLAWIGISLLSIALSEETVKPVMAWIGIAKQGCGERLAYLRLPLPKLSVIIYPVTSGPVFIWTLIFGVYMVIGRKTKSRRPIGFLLFANRHDRPIGAASPQPFEGSVLEPTHPQIAGYDLTDHNPEGNECRYDISRRCGVQYEALNTYQKDGLSDVVGKRHPAVCL